ncbi:hypothetical protein NL676_034702 [Syzygium grande]|nr:hypothetical protein NL676_034702 [Syzygium grande]
MGNPQQPHLAEDTLLQHSWLVCTSRYLFAKRQIFSQGDVWLLNGLWLLRTFGAYKWMVDTLLSPASVGLHDDPHAPVDGRADGVVGRVVSQEGMDVAVRDADMATKLRLVFRYWTLPRSYMLNVN